MKQILFYLFWWIRYKKIKDSCDKCFLYQNIDCKYINCEDYIFIKRW
jgi:hypothetical protein